MVSKAWAVQVVERHLAEWPARGGPAMVSPTSLRTGSVG
jgi:hypothetical protein